MERTCLKVSGRISRRITTVSPMTDAPQLSPTSLCQKRRTASLMSMSGCRTLARTSMVRSARGVVWLEEPLALDRVVPAVAPGIASQQAPSGEHRAAHQAIRADGFDRVRRARRMVLAALRQKRRYEAPVRAHGKQSDAPEQAHAASER